MSGSASLPALIRKLTFFKDLDDSARPAAPTAALPGTPAKVEVMLARARARKSCFHPDDLTVDDCRDLGLVCSVDPANGAASWIEDGDRRRAAASTTLHAVRSESEVRQEIERENDSRKVG